MELLLWNCLQEVSEKTEDLEETRFRHMCSEPLEKQRGWPYELERRLHEHMETSQKKEIKSCELDWKKPRNGFIWQRLKLLGATYIASEHIVFYNGTVIVKWSTTGFREDSDTCIQGHWRQYEHMEQEIYFLENTMYA